MNAPHNKNTSYYSLVTSVIFDVRRRNLNFHLMVPILRFSCRIVLSIYWYNDTGLTVTITVFLWLAIYIVRNVKNIVQSIESHISKMVTYITTL